MGIEEQVGIEIDELLKPGKNTGDFTAAFKRMVDIGAGTYFRKQYIIACSDRRKAAVGKITLCLLALSCKQIKKTEVTI